MYALYFNIYKEVLKSTVASLNMFDKTRQLKVIAFDTACFLLTAGYYPHFKVYF